MKSILPTLSQTILVLSLVTALLFPVSVWSASFDCSKATSKVEKLICSDSDIGVADERLAINYKNILELLNNKEKSALVKQQREWVHKRNQACSNAYDCLKIYYKRIIALKKKHSIISNRSKITPAVDSSQLVESIKSRPLPVKWTDMLTILRYVEDAPKKPTDFVRVLGVSWPDTLQVTLKKIGENNNITFKINNCDQLKKNRGEISGADRLEWDVLMSYEADCKAMEVIANMTQSKITFVNELTPRDYIYDLSLVKIESKYSQVENFFSGLEYEEYTDSCLGKYNCKFETLNDEYAFYILAFGDYDNDGIEDVLFRVRDDYKQGSGNLSLIFIGTKLSHNAPFTLVKVLE